MLDTFYWQIQSKEDDRSQKLTPTEPKGNTTRGVKVNTRTQKFKSQHVSLPKKKQSNGQKV